MKYVLYDFVTYFGSRVLKYVGYCFVTYFGSKVRKKILIRFCDIFFGNSFEKKNIFWKPGLERKKVLYGL